MGIFAVGVPKNALATNVATKTLFQFSYPAELNEDGEHVLQSSAQFIGLPEKP